jgi:hypothetical protein
MGFKQITISAVLLAACSSGGPTKDGSPGEGTTIADSSGSQTGGEGTKDACKTVSVTEIDAEEARTLGFAVDDDLALFDRTFEAPFHSGNLDCSALPPSSDGQIEVRASLQGIDLVRREPSDVPELCPTPKQTYLQYRAVIELTTDDGTLAGSFEGWARRSLPEAAEPAGLAFSVDAEAAAFSGSLGIRVDSGRAHTGIVVGNVVLGATVWASNLFTRVDYADSAEPLQDQGDGIFWPANFQDLNGTALCGWLDVPEEQRTPISIDDFNDL